MNALRIFFRESQFISKKVVFLRSENKKDQMPHSSRGLGHQVFILKIRGSNPLCGTKQFYDRTAFFYF